MSGILRLVPGGRRCVPIGAARLLFTTILAASPAVAAAQTAQQILPPTREEVTRPQPPLPQPRGPRLQVEGEIERAPCALDSPDFQNVRLTLRAVEFEGLQGVTAADLAPAYAGYVGTEQPISVVCEVRDRAATILRNAGYIAAVQVPEQRIENGVVQFRVLMAHLTEVRVRGDATGAERTIAGYLNQLTKKPVFNRFDAERYLLLASDIPGYNVRLTLRPAGTTPGEVIGDVTVQRIPAFADFNAQNSGSRELGRWGGMLRGQVFGLTGLGDRTIASIYTTSDLHEQQTVQLGHDFHIGPQGMTVSGIFTYAWARPEIDDGSDVEARTLLTTFEVGYPFIRRQASTLRGSLGFDLVNQDVELDSIDLTRDRLRVGFARLGWDLISDDFSGGRSLAEPFWRLSSLVELRQGLDVFGATDRCTLNAGATDCLDPDAVPPSRLEGRSDATVFRYNGYGEIRPIRRLTFALGARAQYAWKPLLSFEEFSAGNYTAGRGYDPGALLGDRGFGTQAEVRFGSRVPASANAAALEAYAFWDHAHVKNLDQITLTEGPSNHLNSVGAGARINFDRFAVDTALAFPLTRVGLLNEKPDARWLISLTTRLWPWSYR